MIELKIADYMKLASDLAEIETVLVLTQSGSELDPGRSLTSEEKAWLKTVFMKGITLTNNLNMPVSNHLLARKWHNIPTTREEVAMVIEVIKSEVSKEKFFHMPSYRAKYYECEDLFSDKAKSSFPRGYQELREAGNCLACGQWTAAVFHSMRAAEIGVRALGAALDVTFPDKPTDMAEWHQVLTQAEKKIKDISQLPRDSQRAIDQEFYSQAATQFRFFKDGWRVRVAHSHTSYNEAQAIKAYEHVRDFLESLAPRLSELD